MRLYIEAHGILPDMPVDIVAGKLGLSSHMSAINYEDVVIAAGQLGSRNNQVGNGLLHIFKTLNTTILGMSPEEQRN